MAARRSAETTRLVTANTATNADTYTKPQRENDQLLLKPKDYSRRESSSRVTKNILAPDTLLVLQLLSLQREHRAAVGQPRGVPNDLNPNGYSKNQIICPNSGPNYAWASGGASYFVSPRLVPISTCSA